MGRQVRGKLPCIKCPSSDAVSLYETDDDVVVGHCYSCKEPITPAEVNEHYDGVNPEQVEIVEMQESEYADILKLQCRGWKDRAIPRDVCEFYGVKSKGGVNPTHRYYPITKGGELVGYKARDCKKKDFFTAAGKNSKSCDLFGQSLFPAGGKFLVIVGGEEDVLSASVALNSKEYGRTPVVSPTVGEGTTAEQIKANYDYVTSFEKVIFMLDNDKTGKEATEEAVQLLKPGQAYIASLMHKDPNEYLKKGQVAELRQAFWKAKRYSPIDIMTLGQMWDDFAHQKEVPLVPWPEEFGDLNYMFGGGMALGEVIILGALTSIGKSTLVNKVLHNTYKTTEFPTGILYLESAPGDVVNAMLSIEMKDNLALKPRSEWDMERLKLEFDKFVDTDRKMVSVNHQGAFTSADELFNKVEWMVNACGVKVIIVDPLQAAVPSNENRVIDDFMDKLLKLGKRKEVLIIVVSHVRKPDNADPHSITEYDLKGSSSINQISFGTVLLSRDKMHSDPYIRNCTFIQCVKMRRTGMTGPAGWVHYTAATTELKPVPDPYKEAEEGELGEEDDFEDFDK